MKSVKDKVDEVVNGSKQNLHITFGKYLIADMYESKIKGTKYDREGWDGPLFKDIAGYSINGDWVAVSLKDGTAYVYPANDIARVKHYSEKE